MNNRAGQYKTNLSGDLSYRSFLPAPLPPFPGIIFDEEMNSLLGRASNNLGVLDGIASQLPDHDLFVSMYVRKEALLSSQIEGTQATLDDILDPNIETNINQNVADVINNIKASQFADKRLQELPLCNRLLKETHAVLMADVRGSEKSPGEFRRSQNWIGPAGCTLKDARYIPPSPEDMEVAMSDLEKYINLEDSMDPLIKIALIHYQFETIHPFLDGNGRIGRLLISLFLTSKELLHSNTLYISYFLKRNRIEYYDRLTEVRTKDNYEQWIKFFLLAVIESAQDAINTIHELNDLHQKKVTTIQSAGKATKNILTLFYYLEGNPIIDIKKTSAALQLSFNTVSQAVKQLIEIGILQQTANVQRNRTFAYEAYLKILRKDT